MDLNLNSFEEKDPYLYMAQQFDAGSGLNAAVCSEVKDYMLHVGMATMTRSKMPIIPNLDPLLFQACMTRSLRKRVSLFERYHCRRV